MQIIIELDELAKAIMMGLGVVALGYLVMTLRNLYKSSVDIYSITSQNKDNIDTILRVAPKLGENIEVITRKTGEIIENSSEDITDAINSFSKMSKGTSAIVSTVSEIGKDTKEKIDNMTEKTNKATDSVIERIRRINDKIKPLINIMKRNRKDH